MSFYPNVSCIIFNKIYLTNVPFLMKMNKRFIHEDDASFKYLAKTRYLVTKHELLFTEIMNFKFYRTKRLYHFDLQFHKGL